MSGSRQIGLLGICLAQEAKSMPIGLSCLVPLGYEVGANSCR